MPTKIELKPCPFCGWKADTIPLDNYDSYGNHERLWYVECGNCFSRSGYYDTEGEAAIAWNTRTPGWISCSERMPEKNGNYLCYTEDGDFLQAYYDSAIDDDFPFGIWEQHYDSGTLGWAGEDWFAYDVITHWMPLTEPPEKMN